MAQDPQATQRHPHPAGAPANRPAQQNDEPVLSQGTSLPNGLKRLFPFVRKEGPVPPGGVESKSSVLEGISGFVDTLIRKSVVTREVVEEALAYKRQKNGLDRRLLFHILIDEFSADREAIFSEFVQYYSIRSVDLQTQDVPPEQLAFITRVLNALPSKIRESALAARLLPFRTSEADPTKLEIITPDPSNTEIGRIAGAFPFPRYEVVYVSLEHFEVLYRTLLSDSQTRLSTTDLSFVEQEQDPLLDELDEEIRRGHINELVDTLILDAVRLNASDLHIVPRGPRRTEIHFRLDGRLTLWQSIDDLRADAVAAVVKDLSKGPDRFERDMAQDGFIQKTFEGKVVRFRVSVIPLMGKELKVKLESIVLRILRDPEASITVDNIGFQPEARERFQRAIMKPYGIVILTGPTGCGKSTTLLAALRAVMNPAYNILTVEDPVEYFIDGARQVKLNPKLGFEEALRAILRHDPDIVMVGEIRDRQSADLAVKLANTGHLTFTTLHTNDAPSAISRLYKMGIEPFLLAYSINLIVAQRLVRKLCDRCKTPDTTLKTQFLQGLGFSGKEVSTLTFYRPVGCLHCLRGYKGRTAIHEVLEFTPEIRELIMDAGGKINEEAIRRIAESQGMQNLRHAGLELIRRGITTVEEVASTTTNI